jgi:hypothetical protein
MRVGSGSLALAILSLTYALAACSSDDAGTTGISSGSGAASNASGSGASGTGAATGSWSGAAGGSTSSTGAGGTINVGTGGASGGSGPGAGNEDTCDGVDNDGNGIVDDVDVGKDGVCDCLRIGTLGEPGEWGDGNIFAAWLDARAAQGAVVLGDQEISAATLGDLQVLVVQNVSEIGREYSDAEVQALEAWVRGGGGLMTLIGYADPSERSNVNRLLAPSGLSYADQPILPKQGGATVPITQWFPHPASDGVTGVGVDNGYPVSGGGTLVAQEDDFDLARATELDSGKVFVWGDEWITYDSEWSEHPEYQVELLWLNIIKFLTPANECQVPIPDTVK